MRLLRKTEREVKLIDDMQTQHGNNKSLCEAKHNLNYEASSSEDEEIGLLAEDMESISCSGSPTKKQQMRVIK